jgi:hypothetical protein
VRSGVRTGIVDPRTGVARIGGFLRRSRLSRLRTSTRHICELSHAGLNSGGTHTKPGRPRVSRARGKWMRQSCHWRPVRLHRPHTSGLRGAVFVDAARRFEVSPGRGSVRRQARTADFDGSAVARGDLERQFAAPQLRGRNLDGSGTDGQCSPFVVIFVCPLVGVGSKSFGCNSKFLKIVVNGIYWPRMDTDSHG